MHGDDRKNSVGKKKIWDFWGFFGWFLVFGFFFKEALKQYKNEVRPEGQSVAEELRSIISRGCEN